MAMRTFEMIGVPTSAGAVQSGIELAPAALRAAGLPGALEKAGQVVDRRDDPPPYRRNASCSYDVAAAAEYAGYARDRVRRAIGNGAIPIVLGGDCSIEIGVVAAHLDVGHRVGLVYFDGHPDLNLPGSVPNPQGVFTEGPDWMVNAHLLGIDGAYPALAGIGPKFPLLDPQDLAIVGLIDEQTTPFESQKINELNIKVLYSQDIERQPERAVRELMETWGAQFDRVIVHLDTDVLDFDETPIAEAAVNHGIGTSLDTARQVLSALAADRRFGGLTITEVYPPHADNDTRFVPALRRFVETVAAALRSRED